MEQTNIRQTITRVRDFLEKGGYANGTILQFNSTTNQLLKFMDTKGIGEYSTAVGLDFMKKHYSFSLKTTPSFVNQCRLRHLQKISEFQLHGAAIYRSCRRTYNIPADFREATDRFLAHRRFEGIIERNMSTVILYLERFFSYLTGQDVQKISEISITHIHGFLRFLTGFSNSTKDHTLRTVRQFMEFCFKNGYHPNELSPNIPTVHYEKRSRIPSAYSYDDVMKLLSLVDRANPIGKRDYAALLLLARLGIRCGDICRLKYENIDWERNVISFTQHKTGKPITLPLLEDVGMAIIDYLKFGRPKCDSDTIFIRHRPPVGPFISKSLYMMVSGYISKAGLLTQGKKRGPHALRHSLASRLLEENVPLPVISEILGHANTNTTAVYLSLSVGKLRSCALEV